MRRLMKSSSWTRRLRRCSFSIVAIEPAREQVMDGSALGETLDAGVFVPREFAPKDRGAPAPMDALEGQELAGHEVARMGRHEVKKTGFGLGVAKGFERIEVVRRDVHSVKISRVSSRSSRMRRRRDASSARP